MLDYLYGKLNKEVEQRKFKGITTSETKVVIDEIENTIKVELTPENEMSNTSTNIVQNKVIKEYIDTKFNELKEYIDSKLGN